MTPGVGILDIGLGHINMHYFFKYLLYLQAKIDQTESIVMMTKKRSTKIVNLIIIILGLGHICHKVRNENAILLLPFLLFYSMAWIRQITYVIMMTKEGFTKNCKFNYPWGYMFVFGWGGC